MLPGPPLYVIDFKAGQNFEGQVEPLELAAGRCPPDTLSYKVQYEASIDHLRHSKFAGLREDKDARTVIKEHGGEG